MYAQTYVISKNNENDILSCVYYKNKNKAYHNKHDSPLYFLQRSERFKQNGYDNKQSRITRTSIIFGSNPLNRLGNGAVSYVNEEMAIVFLIDLG